MRWAPWDEKTSFQAIADSNRRSNVDKKGKEATKSERGGEGYKNKDKYFQQTMHVCTSMYVYSKIVEGKTPYTYSLPFCRDCWRIWLLWLSFIFIWIVTTPTRLMRIESHYSISILITWYAWNECHLSRPSCTTKLERLEANCATLCRQSRNGCKELERAKEISMCMSVKRDLFCNQSKGDFSSENS